MAAGNKTASQRDLLGSPFADEIGRPIGEYQPSALDRLNRLHNESVETARLANLLGRVPFAAAAFALGYGLIAFSAAGSAPVAALGLWGIFIAAAVAAMLRVRRQATASAFELLPLRAFALDLNAVMLFAGFAWGAGAFLGLQSAAGAASLILFSLGGAALLGAILRARGATLYFLVPNVALASIAAFFGTAGPGIGLLILLCGLAVVAAIEVFERIAVRRAYAPVLPSLTLS